MNKQSIILALCASLVGSPVCAKTFVGILWPMFGPTAAPGLVELVAELKMMPDVEIRTYLHQSWPSLVEDIDQQPSGTAAVVHFAALAYVGESSLSPTLYYRNNVGGTAALLDAMRESGVAKIVFSSSCAIYGAPEVVPIPEATPYAPINPYGATKMICDSESARRRFRYRS